MRQINESPADKKASTHRLGVNFVSGQQSGTFISMGSPKPFALQTAVGFQDDEIMRRKKFGSTTMSGFNVEESQSRFSYSKRRSV